MDQKPNGKFTFNLARMNCLRDFPHHLSQSPQFSDDEISVSPFCAFSDAQNNFLRMKWCCQKANCRSWSCNLVGSRLTEPICLNCPSQASSLLPGFCAINRPQLLANSCPACGEQADLIDTFKLLF